VTQFSERPRYEIGRVIERTFGVIAHNFIPFSIFSLVLIGLPMLGFGLLSRAYGLDNAANWQPSYFIFFLVGIVLWMMVNVILQGALLRGAIDDLSGGKADMRTMLESGLRNSPKLFAIGLLIFIMCCFAVLGLIVGAFFVAVLFAAAAPAAVAEGRGVFDSLGRSIKLTRNHRWAIFGLSVIFMVMILLFFGIVSAVILGVGYGLGLDILTVRVFLDPPVTALEIMVITAAYAAQYHELRTAQEGVGDRAVESVFE
jgi:hypothetical protein